MVVKNLIAVVLLTSNIVFATESDTWSYVGRTGPDHWSKLDEDFAACSQGMSQSPINLDQKNLIHNKEPIIFYYEPDNVVSLKHYSIKIEDKSFKHIEIDNKIYRLVQFHFHMPSEHSINNKIYPAELHFVHQDKDANLAVVGVFLTEGASNKVIKEIIDTANKGDKAKHAIGDDDLMNLIPKNKEYFHYMGSLTTPPCTEGVHWYVMKNPIEMSKEEIAELDKIMPENARPIQDPKGRVAK